jgi:hypothetical protein
MDGWMDGGWIKKHFFLFDNMSRAKDIITNQLLGSCVIGPNGIIFKTLNYTTFQKTSLKL